MTGTMKNKPAKCCCCPCWKDTSLAGWTAESGTWTSSNTVTTDDDAILVSVRESLYRMLKISATSNTNGDIFRAGFRGTSGNQVYVEVTRVGSFSASLSMYEHEINESRVLLGGPYALSVTWPFSIELLYDLDYCRFSVWNTRLAAAVWKFDITIGDGYGYGDCGALPFAFIGTGTIAGTVTFSAFIHDKNCMCRYCPYSELGTPDEISTGPSEFDISIAGCVCTLSKYDPFFNGDYTPVYDHDGGGFGSVSAGSCYWTRTEYTGGFGGPNIFHEIQVDYAPGTNSTTVTLIAWLDGSGNHRVGWRRSFAGRLDARTIDISGANQFTSTDVYFSTNVDASAATASVVASP